MIIAPPDTYLNENKINSERCLKKEQNFITDYIRNARIICSSRNQPMSIGTGLIPFLEHDDANRALMGSNMQKQALPLIYKELPFIETGIENQVSKSSQMTKLAKKSGFIEFVSKNRIVTKGFTEKLNTLNNLTIKSKCKNRLKSNLKSLRCKKQFYKLEKNRRSNQNTEIYQIPLINNKEWIRKGQIITDGSATLNGKLSLGKNILIAYMSWRGYNFEDAVVISKRLVDNDIFTSTCIKKQKIFLTNKEKQEVRIRN